MKQALAFPRCDCIRVVVHAARKVASTIREAKRRKARSSTCPHQIGCGRVLSGGRSPSGASPRLSPATRRSADSAPGHASWDVDPAGATRLHLSQSRDCTSRTGRSTGVTDARSRPGAVRNAARRDRPRSTFESTLAKGPSVNEMGMDVTRPDTVVKWSSLNTRRKASEANLFKPSRSGQSI